MKLNTSRELGHPNWPTGFQWFLIDLHNSIDLSGAGIAEAIGMHQSKFSKLAVGREDPTDEERRAILKVVLKRIIQRRDEVAEMIADSSTPS